VTLGDLRDRRSTRGLLALVAQLPVRLRSWLLTIILPGLTASLALASGPVLWHPASNLSSSQGRSTHATLVRDPATGDLFSVWMDEGVAERPEIMGRRWDSTYETWFPTLYWQAENLSLSEWHDGGPMVHFDLQGHGVLLWTRRYSAFQGAPADGTDLMWRSWDGVSWSDEQVLFHSDSYLPSSFGYGLIPVETPDSLLLFITWATNYRTTEYNNGIWSELSPWIQLEVELAHVTRDELGVLHAAAYGDNSSDWGFDPWFYDGYYLANDGTGWTVPVNLSSTDGVVRDLGLVLDRDGRLHFLWSDSDSPYSSESLKSAIWERVFNGATWTANAEVTNYNPDQAINGFALTTDVTSTLHLAWSEGLMRDGTHTELGIYYQTGDGSNWGPEVEEVHISSPDSRYPVLITGDEQTFVTWQEGAAPDRDVFFSRRVVAGPCQGLSEATISGPTAGSVGESFIFTATSHPLTATWPVTYTWLATEQSQVIHSGGFIDAIGFLWHEPGVKAINVTAENCGGRVFATYAIDVGALKSTYLPLIWKERTP
jgi:hypothetical protein